MTAVEVFAPAKINLTLHVTGQRADGYHLLDSLVTFADVGDRVTLAEADVSSLSLSGPFARVVPAGNDNLVLRAARLCAPGRSVAITLEKNLPPASGIGGGSADAAAVARGMAALFGGTSRDEELLSLGADVPMCQAARPVRVRGIGEMLAPVDDLPSLAAVLVNPLREMPTPPVFRALATKANPPMLDPIPAFRDPAALTDWLVAQRNDLERPASAILPEIGDVMSALSGCAGARLVRMSGSGATCFAVFATAETAARAAAALSSAHPDWWVRATTLGDQAHLAAPV